MTDTAADQGGFRDFDAAWARRDRHTFKAFGETHTLPTEMPIKLMLFAERIMASGRDPRSDLRFDELVEMLTPIFGREQVQRWIDELGCDAGQLTDLLTYAMEVWSPSGAGDGAGNSASPAARSPG